jgi:capsular polysaccharide biosynthesis protein
MFRVLAAVLAACAVASASLQQTPTYEASALMWVDWRQEGRWETLEYRVPPPTQEIMHTIGTRGVAQEATQRLGLQMDPDELLDKLTVEQVENTGFMRLTYEGTDPAKAARIVNTVGEVFSDFVSTRSSSFTVTVWEKVAAPETPVSPHPLRNGLLTLVTGLALCAGNVVVRPDVGARVAGTLSEWAVRPIGEARLSDGRHGSPIEAERIKEQELLEALDRRGKLTAVEVSLETSLSVEEADRMLFELAAKGHLEVTIEHGKLLYSFWGSTEDEHVAGRCARDARPSGIATSRSVHAAHDAGSGELR